MISYPGRLLPFLAVGFMLLQTTLVGQETVTVERSTNKVILEGTVYYVHVVKPGETLYAISRAYNISQKEIAIENPGVVSGIRVGQALKIPVEPALEEDIDTSGADEPGPSGRTHTVQPGETLYSISRSYGLNESDLLEANEGVDPSGLRPGQQLLIPDLAEQEPQPAFNEEGFAYHTVKRRETLYSISRYYGVAVQEIRDANPELGWGGPRTGQTLRIPLPQVIDHPETVAEYVPLDSLEMPVVDEGDVVPYAYEELALDPDDLFRTFRVAFFIPFDFTETEPLDSLLKDVDSPARRNRIIERYVREQRIPQSVNFLEFFQGSLLAVDSIRQTGMNVEVHYFDTRRSIDRTLSILVNGDLEDYDLFIGPFYTFNLEIVVAFAREHRIPVVTPFYNELDFVASNPYLFQTTPSLEYEYQEAARIVASKYNYNIVYVREEDSLDVEKHAYFKKLIFDGFEAYRPSEPVVFKEVVLSLDHTDEILHSLSKDKRNLVVVPTPNEALASRVVSSLYFQLKDYRIEVLGSPFWTEFSSIDLRYYHALNLIFYSTFWVDHQDPSVNRYLARFRERFHNEPRETTRRGINYGIIGYDLTFYFLNAMQKYGSRFILRLDEYEPVTVQKPYRFRRVNNSGGYENEQLSFYQFYPDMTIREIMVPDLPVRHYFFRPLEDRRQRRFLYLDREQE